MHKAVKCKTCEIQNEVMTVYRCYFMMWLKYMKSTLQHYCWWCYWCWQMGTIFNKCSVCHCQTFAKRMFHWLLSVSWLSWQNYWLSLLMHLARETVTIEWQTWVDASKRCKSSSAWNSCCPFVCIAVTICSTWLYRKQHTNLQTVHDVQPVTSGS